MNETHCFNNKFADTVLWWSGSCSYARPMFKFKEKSMWKCYSFWLISVPVNETSSLLVLQTTPTTISAEPVDQNKRERKKNHRTENTFAWWCFLFYFLLIRNSVPSNKLHGRRSPEKKPGEWDFGRTQKRDVAKICWSAISVAVNFTSWTPEMISRVDLGR